MYLKLIFISIFLFSLTKFNTLSGQKSDSVFLVVEQMPEFIGGQIALNKYIWDSLNINNCHFDAIQTIYKLSFIVMENGELNELKILNESNTCICNEIIRLFEKMPPWNPGMHEGEKVKVNILLPIRIELR